MKNFIVKKVIYMKNFEVLIKNKDILSRIKKLAKQIDERYKKESIVLICVLKGSIMFFAELIKNIKNENVLLDFIQVKSYNGTSSTGEINLVKDITINIENNQHFLQ